MLPSPTYVFSDAHIGFAAPEAERSLLEFLRHLHGRAGSLVINGDLFEFWFEWRHVMPRRGFRVLAALADLHDAGIPVLMIAGNHDCWGGDILRKDAGIDFRLGPWEGELAGWHTRIEHGDGLRGKEDKRYRALRRVLRNPLSIRAFRWLHPDLGAGLANRSSHASRTYVARDEGRGLREVGERELRAHPELELLIYGHSHVPALVRTERGQVYANAGTWIDSPTFLRATPTRIELRRWDGSAEGTHLDAADHPAKEALPQL